MTLPLLEELAQRVERGERCVLATVVATEGSAPAQAAMKMLVGPAGRIAGTVGGGRVEAAVLARAQAGLDAGTPEVLSFTLDDDAADEGGLLCGGTVRILVEAVAPPAAWARDAADLLRRGRRGVLLARIGGGRVRREVAEGSSADPWLADENPRLEKDLFVEPLVRPRCIVVGAGHVGRAVAVVAKAADFGVAVVEDRPDQAGRAEADETVCADDLAEGYARLDPSPFDYVVVTTRGHGLDLRCVRAALLSPARYVGMLSSRKKAATIRETLGREGVGMERLHAPVGLDLGAVSAGEIAVSVVAQLIKVRRLGRGDR